MTVFSANRLVTGTLVRSPAEAPKTTARPGGGEQAQALVQHVTAHGLQDQVETGGRGLPHLRGPAGLGVVDGHVRAQFLEEAELGREAVAMTVPAPCRRASWTARWPIAPAPAVTRTVSPAASRPARSAPRATAPAVGTMLAAPASSPPGTVTSQSVSATT